MAKESKLLTPEEILENEMDEVLRESFPASDPPAWGSIAAKVATTLKKGIKEGASDVEDSTV